MFNQIKIHYRLIFLFLFIGLLPAVLGSFFVLDQMTAAVKRNALLDLEGRRDVKQQMVERWVSTRLSNIEMLARSELAVSTILRLGAAEVDLDIRSSNENYFQDFERLYGFDEVLMVGQNGTILFSTDVLRSTGSNIHAESQEVSEAFGQTLYIGRYVTDLIRNQDVADKTYMYIGSSVRSGEQVVGAVIARLPATRLNNIMVERSGMGESGEMFIVGDDSFSRSELNTRNAESKTRSDILNTAINSRSIKRALSGIQAIGEELDYRGVPVLASYSKLDIPFLNWALVLKIDESEVLSPVSQIKTVLSIFIVVLIGFVGIFSWYFARGISEPIKGLTQAADYIATGDLSQEFVVTGNDEITLLTRALGNIQSSQRQVVELAENIVSGSQTDKLAERGADDKLVNALNQMVDVLMDVTDRTQQIAGGDYTQRITLRSDNDQLGTSLNKMSEALLFNEQQNRQQAWLRDSLAEINNLVLGQSKLEVLANNILSEIAERLNVAVGAFYANTDESKTILKLTASYALSDRKYHDHSFNSGEGLVGQVALERKPMYLSHIPDNYMSVSSGIGSTSPAFLNLLPLVYENKLIGVIEVGTLSGLTETQRTYFESISLPIATAFEVIRSRLALEDQQTELEATNSELVRQTNVLQQAEQELLSQQEKLQMANKNLEDQTRELEASETELQSQQLQLAETNRELEMKNDALEQQASAIEAARLEVSKQAEDLTLANRYKSEFLANMSHELRTPLNSLLLLARSFNLNETGNLTTEQVDEAKIIYDSGNDLLNLINEILDLAKIESGRIELQYQDVDIKELLTSVEGQFQHMAKSQGLGFSVNAQEPLPTSFVTDPLRLGQVIKNLVGNALKFTEDGSISVTVTQVRSGDFANLNIKSDELLQFEFTDTGIGIETSKQSLVFEAFQQIDGGDARKYGGTGLGLSITRELVNLLGGEITLTSEFGHGSTFTVFLPLLTDVEEHLETSQPIGHQQTQSSSVALDVPVPYVSPEAIVHDDRDFITEDDAVILVIEDDETFARILASEVTKRGYKILVAMTGEEGIALASRYLPTGIILDLHLPHMDGWSVLHNLKQNIDTRHIPVHIASADEVSSKGLRVGAIGHVTKPINAEDIQQVLEGIEHVSGRDKKYVLLVEDDELVRSSTAKAIGNDVVSIIEVDNGQSALDVVRDGGLDLIVLDLNLPDMQGVELLQTAAQEKLKLPPVIINTARDLTEGEEQVLREYSDSIVIKDVRSHERLVDEVALFLHRVVKQLPTEKRQIIQHLHASAEPLLGKTVLIAEDDMRTLFVMTKILTELGMTPIKAENGRKALDVLESGQHVDIVLMDMMMPMMDGYEAMTKIRQNPEHADLPIIALTAKAMKEDRLKCIDAGASDYMTKPVDQDKLTSLMRVWLSRSSVEMSS